MYKTWMGCDTTVEELEKKAALWKRRHDDHAATAGIADLAQAKVEQDEVEKFIAANTQELGKVSRLQDFFNLTIRFVYNLDLFNISSCFTSYNRFAFLLFIVFLQLWDKSCQCYAFIVPSAGQVAVSSQWKEVQGPRLREEAHHD